MLTFYLKTPNATTPTPVCISIYCHDGRLRKSIKGIKADPSHWENGWFRNIPKNKELAVCRSKVEKIKLKIEKHISNCENNDQPILKDDISRLTSSERVEAKRTFLEMYDQLINDAQEGKLLKKRGKTRLSDGYLITWKKNRNLLERFQKSEKVSIEPAQLTIHTVLHFVGWMNECSEIKPTLNYVGHMVTLWRNALVIMKDMGLHNNPVINDGRFRGTFEIVDKIKLDEADVIRLFNHDLSGNPLEQAIRDRWVLMFCTGLRVGDSSRLNLDHFSGSAITLINQKTGKKVVIPHHWMTMEILQRYGGSLPPGVAYHIMTKKIKEIAKEVGFVENFTYKITRGGIKREETKPKWELFVNHTARRSMTSHLIKSGVGHDLGGDMMGMSSQTWTRYNKLSPEDKANVLKDLAVFKKKPEISSL